MRVFFCWLAALGICLASQRTNGAVFERDFLTLGDGLLTYDDVNRREWLDLTYSTGIAYSQLETLASGGEVLSDFHFATLQDIEKLASSAGVIWIDRDDEQATALTFENARRLQSMLGDVFSFRIDFVNITAGAAGFISRNTSVGQIAVSNQEQAFDGRTIALEVIEMPSGTVRLANPAQYRDSGFTETYTSSQLPIATGDAGPFWLFREAVPEPSTLVLFYVALASVATTRLGRRSFKQSVVG